ncbi:MAG: aspartate kinase [Gemmatimonadota bacterium]
MNESAHAQTASTAAPRRILKFGGTSVTGRARVSVLADVVRERRAHTHPVVVVSAQSGVTDLLLELARSAAAGEAYDGKIRELVDRHRSAAADLGVSEADVAPVEELVTELERLLHGVSLLRECSPGILSRLLAFGELASARLVAAALSHSHGLPAEPIDAAELIVADLEHGHARVDWAATEARVQDVLGAWDGPVPIVTGFLAATGTGLRTTLGRGGSDSSAAIIGWALGADAVEIWTDVDGVLTADPRVVADARPIRALHYAELLELAHWGGKVVHPDAVRPLRERGIPLVVRNTMRPDDPGTVVSGDPVRVDRPVRSIALLESVATLHMTSAGRSQAASRVMHALDQAALHPLVTSHGGSDGSVWVAVRERDIERAKDALRRTFATDLRNGAVETPTIEMGLSTISLVGTSDRLFSETAARVISALATGGIEVRGIARGAEAPSITCVVDAAHGAAAMRALHDAFFHEADVMVDAAGPAPTAEWSDDVIGLARRLVEIPSVTGSEGHAVNAVAEILAADGWQLTRQSVAPGRDNLWATRGEGVVTLSTHLDTVPGSVPVTIRDGRLYGRGSCDAKGIAAAMIVAANRLAAAGETRVDLLFVVGEEGRSDGARAANELPATSRFLVNGEPTEGALASGAKGTLQARVRTNGSEAHSAYPERGSSAVHAMVSRLHALADLELPTDSLLGPTTINVGTIHGGSAPNVLAGACEASLMIRLVGEPDPVRDLIEEWAGDAIDVAWVSHVPAQRFTTVPGFEIASVGYTTDASLLTAWGEPLLYGPGSIHVAHTPEEFVPLDDLHQAVEDYQRIVRELLS